MLAKGDADGEQKDGKEGDVAYGETEAHAAQESYAQLADSEDSRETGHILQCALACLVGDVQHVADAAHGLDHFFGPLVVDFAAQVADVDVDDIGEAVVIHIPDVLDDHSAAEGAAAVAHQVFEDAEFLGSELDILAGTGDFATD